MRAALLPIAIAWQALYRPHDLARTLLEGRAARRRALLGSGAALWAICLAAYAVFGQLLRPSDLAAIIVSAPLYAFVLMIMAMQVAPAGLDIGARAVFWFACTQSGITPILMFGWAAAALPGRSGALTIWQIALIIFVCGWACGACGALTLATRAGGDGAGAARWRMSIGLVFLAGLLAWSPQTRGTDWAALIPFCLGMGLAPLRPFSWLAQAAWPGSPAGFDQLRLLPLPRTGARLFRMAVAQPEQAAAALIERADHPADAGLARRVLRDSEAAGRGHAIYFRLSLHPAGGELLRRAASAGGLAGAYATLAAVDHPAAWLQALRDCQPMLAAQPIPPDLDGLEPALATARAILAARRWRDLRPALANLPVAAGRRPEELTRPLASLRRCADTAQTVAAAEEGSREVAAIIGERGDWAARLCLSLSEHLIFLRSLE